ncbi:hypothetical protein CXG81DRAFT_19522 [Caulochytrium protostelioides]|uniref:Uncharacterized protein n=1 Tax=Caulochytrium protostelioides TaxID=1555241 RepID=A0A4P9X5U2_9FUNG|nr:hypothetical protein CXG81DRAFT_19522 [Caulochytrium protostelioides]|eukprot:RKP00527.1 hypothetical protein CXG81DRAFT_19522 [Caulochytrium protostelioides]
MAPPTRTALWMRLLIMATLLVALMTPLAAAQDNNNNNGNGDGGGNGSSATATASATASASATSSAPSATATAACGNSPGVIQIMTPTSSSYLQVGTEFNITWQYSALTNTSQFPAKSLVLYYQNQASTATWTESPGLNISTRAKSFLWKPPQMADGNYKVRLVADGLDPQQKMGGTCIPNGFPGPGTSATFRIINNIQLPQYPDSYGPNSGASTHWTTGQRWRAAMIGGATALIGLVSTLIL